MVAVAQDPAEDLVEPVDDEMQVDASVRLVLQALAAMPEGLADLGGDPGAETEPDLVAVLAAFHRPRQPQESFEVEARWDRVGVDRRRDSLDPGDSEDADLAMQGRAAQHVPGPPGQHEPIEAQFRRDRLGLDVVTIPDPDLVSLRQGVEDRVVDELAFARKGPG